MKFITKSVGVTLFVIISATAVGQTSANKVTLEEITLEAYQDLIHGQEEFLFVNFWASWCKPCISELPDLIDFYTKNNLPTVLVSLDHPKSRASAQRILTRYKIQHSYMLLTEDHILTQISENWNGAIPLSILYKNGDRLQEFPRKLGKTDFQNIQSLIH